MPTKLVRKRLDDAGVEAHFAEVAAQGQALELRVKDAAAHYSSATAEQLHDAGLRLRQGAIAAVQLRFFRDGDWWCDTVMRAADGYRLVRMRQVSES